MAYSHLPRQRRLNETETEEAVKILKFEGNRKLLQGHIQKTTKKVFTLIDLKNLRKKHICVGEETTVRPIVEKLRQIEGMDFQIFSEIV